MSNKTFTMIKPDATSKGYTGAILDQIIKAGFSVKAMKWIHLSPAQAGTFYEVHKERPFYQELVDFMSSGPIVAAILEKEKLLVEILSHMEPKESKVGLIIN
jgi:nucleoside-diphosphate kinase